MITHDYKLIFIHVPKCAGRSVCEVFNQRFDHFPLQHYKTWYPDFYSSYYKMAIVRNPYDRLVSLFHYIKEHRRHRNEPIYSSPDFKTWLITNMVAYSRTTYNMSPEMERGTDGRLGSPFQFAAQVDFINPKYDLDGLFFFEDIGKVSAFLDERCGPGMKLKHLNKSEHDAWISYYDSELCEYCRCFEPIKRDCKELGYNLI